MNDVLLAVLPLSACSDPERPALAPPAVWVDARKAPSGGTLTLHAPAGSTLEVDRGELVPAPEGEDVWTLHGPDGSYIVTVTPQGAPATRVFVDFGVDGPTGGPLDDLAALPPPPPSPWPWVAAGIAGLAVVGFAGPRLLRVLRRPAPPPPPDPPHLLAARAWQALRARTDLGDEELAAQMSRIVRQWLDATQGFPATQRTTREILDNLAGTFTALELDAVRRLLMATDLVKFAERHERPNLFAQLDGDFAAVVRPPTPRPRHA